jgi:hypothetical protein
VFQALYLAYLRVNQMCIREWINPLLNCEELLQEPGHLAKLLAGPEQFEVLHTAILKMADECGYDSVCLWEEPDSRQRDKNKPQKSART